MARTHTRTHTQCSHLHAHTHTHIQTQTLTPTCTHSHTHIHVAAYSPKKPVGASKPVSKVSKIAGRPSPSAGSKVTAPARPASTKTASSELKAANAEIEKLRNEVNAYQEPYDLVRFMFLSQIYVIMSRSKPTLPVSLSCFLTQMCFSR